MNAARPAPWPVLLATSCLLLAGIAACSSSDAPSGASVGPSGLLASSIAARVGSLEIPAETVARIAAAQGIEPARARDLAVRDALFASEAYDRELSAELSMRAALRGAHARALLRDIYAAAVRAGPVTDAELREATERRWFELDRPAGSRTVHAVVRLNEKDDAARRKKASEIADALRAAVAPLGSSEEALREPPSSSADPPAPAAPPLEDPLIALFKARVASVPRDGFEIVAEELPPVTADGRVLEPGGFTFAPEFAAAAAALTRRGDLSPPVLSPFGFHVILLLERTPPRAVPADERRKLVLRDVIAQRARAAEASLLERLREQTSVDPTVDAALALVPVGAP
jgi:peptidyl-prolyl cis-trans isomerase C